jgi:hypothetical protein
VEETAAQASTWWLVNSLEQLHDLNTRVIGPLTFGPNRRVGSTGSYIVGVDSSKKQYVLVSGRIEPEDRR